MARAVYSDTTIVKAAHVAEVVAVTAGVVAADTLDAKEGADAAVLTGVGRR